MLELKTKIQIPHQPPWRWRSCGNAWSLPWQRATILNILHPTNSMPSYNVKAPTMHYIGHLEDIQGKMEVYALVHYKNDHSSEVTAFPPKTWGRPLELGESLNTPFQKYVRALQLASTPVSSSLVQAAAEGIIVSKDRTVLTENGGHVALTWGWALSFRS